MRNKTRSALLVLLFLSAFIPRAAALEISLRIHQQPVRKARNTKRAMSFTSVLA